MRLPSRQTVQKWTARLAEWAFAILILAPLGEWIIEYLREKRFYASPGEKVSAVFHFLTAITGVSRA